MIKLTYASLFAWSVVFFAGCNSTKQVTRSKSGATDNAAHSPEPEIYQQAYTKLNDLVHTRLEVKPDFEKKQLQGQAVITLRPHFYQTDSLVLNARAMDLHEVSILKNGTRQTLRYSYQNDRIRIKLDTLYTRDDKYTVFIDYTANPENLKPGGSKAIKQDKGLYFINADGKDPDNPKQVWTQGETESNSAWFPTIESPNQKMTQEIYITVDTSFKTLSNGLFISSVLNKDGTRTDYWKQSLPAAPYLSMFAAGDYAIVKDKWRNIDVNYYLDKPYEKYARMIFGHTPEMIEFFSKLLGVDYPWEKFSQIVVHDFVSGAMENTTAVVHGTNMQQDPREYLDGNFEDYISHELFHHWFGDLVTCESWANITLNEGFANYSEYLWREHKFGREDADILNQSDQFIYFSSTRTKDPPLIRYQYNDREEIYDAISYDKGGRVLHMLRKYVGDEAFFTALHDYLEAHKFSTAEIQDLRLAFEKVTGEDLNWFFTQWFLKGGHPELNISHSWDDNAQVETVSIQQTQDFSQNPLYRLPMDVDFYYNGKIERKRIVLEKVKQDFVFDFPVKPDLVNVDAEKALCGKKKEDKSGSELEFQYHHAPLYLDRYEAVSKIGANYRPGTPGAGVIRDALHDRNWKIRFTALDNIGELAKNIPDTVKSEIISLARSDSSSDVREHAWKQLNKYYKYTELSGLYEQALHDTSYQVVARAFKIIAEKDSLRAFQIAEVLEGDSSSEILEALTGFYAEHNQKDKNDLFAKAFRKTHRYYRYMIVRDYQKYLKGKEDPVFHNGIEQLFNFGLQSSSSGTKSLIVSSLKSIQSELKYRLQVKKDAIEKMKPELARHPETILDNSEIAELNKQSDFIDEKITALEKVQ